MICTFLVFLSLKGPFGDKERVRDTLGRNLVTGSKPKNQNSNTEISNNHLIEFLGREIELRDLHKYLGRNVSRERNYSAVNKYKKYIPNCKSNEIRFNDDDRIVCAKLPLENNQIENCEIYSSMRTIENYKEKMLYYCDECSKNAVKLITTTNRNKYFIQCKKIDSSIKLIEGCDVYLNVSRNLRCLKYFKAKKSSSLDMNYNETVVKSTKTDVNCNAEEVKYKNELNNNIIECATLFDPTNPIDDCDVYSDISVNRKCAVCKSSMFLDPNSGYQCSENCSIAGEVKVLGIGQTVGGYCTSAPMVPIDRCAIYSEVSEDIINCHTCLGSSSTNTKVCVPNICDNGKDNCNICETEGKCTICEKNYFLDLGACSSGCPGKVKVIKTTVVGYEGKEIGFCEDFPSNPIENCEIYDEFSDPIKTICRKCAKGKVKQLLDDGKMLCSSLEDPNLEINDCEAYSEVSISSTKCKICGNNKFLNDNFQCLSDCKPGLNDQKMVKLQPDDSIIGGTCKPEPVNPIASCEIYSDITPNQLKCKVCGNSNFLDNNICQAVCKTAGTVKVIPITEMIGGRCEKEPLFPLIDRCDVYSDISSEDKIRCNRCNDADIVNTTICPPPSCQNGNNGCDTCQDNNNCLLCLEGYFLDSGVCSQGCPAKVKVIFVRRETISGEEKPRRTCESKPTNIIDGCDIYENVSPTNPICKYCKRNFVQFENSSLINVIECRQLEDQSKIINGCDIYSDISKSPKCKMCDSKHFLDKSGQCVSTCPDGYVNVEPLFTWNSGNVCDEEPTSKIDDCLVYMSVANSNNPYSPTLCKTCISNFFLDLNDCVPNCTDGFTNVQPISSTVGGTCDDISFSSTPVEYCKVYYLASDGEAVYRCKTCQADKFLNSIENVCVDDCDSYDMVKYQPENSDHGGICVTTPEKSINYCDTYSSIEPLAPRCKVCIDGKTKAVDECPVFCKENTGGCAKCDLTTNLCVRCHENYFLNRQIGICSSKCPENQVKVIPDPEEGSEILNIGGTCEDEPSLTINYCEIYSSTSPYSLHCRVCYDGITKNVDVCEPYCLNNRRKCMFCNIADKCTKCQDNYFLDHDLGICRSTCPKGTIKLDDVLNGGACEKKVPISPISYCDTYSSIDQNHKIVCKECFDGTKNVLKCPTYCKDGKRGCETCNSLTNMCSKCLPNYFMESETGICTDFCPIGMVKVLKNEVNGGKCEPKPQSLITNCDVYSDISTEPYPTCKLCEANFKLIENNRCEFAVKSCELGGRSNCVECSRKNISLCGMCKNRKYLLNGDCFDDCRSDSTTVPSMQDNSSTGFGFKCLNIPKKIENCDIYESVSPLKCSRCINEMYVQNRTCVTQCEEGYKIDEVNKICIYTCSIEYCSQCPIKKDKCELCDDKHILYNNKCIEQCPNGTFANKTRCDKCFDGCIKCGDEGKCIECNITHYFFEKMCYIECPAGTQRNINGEKNCFLFFPDVPVKLSNISDGSRSFIISGDSVNGNSRIPIESNKLIITKYPDIEIFFKKTASNTNSLFFGSNLKFANYLIKTPDNIQRGNVIGFRTSEQTKIEVDTQKVNINIFSDKKDYLEIGSNYTSVVVNYLILSKSEFNMTALGHISYLNFKAITMYQDNKLYIQENKDSSNTHITADLVFVQRGANVYVSGLKIQQNLEILEYSHITLSNTSRIDESAKIDINTNNYLPNKKPAILVESNSVNIRFNKINILFSGKSEQSALLYKHLTDESNRKEKIYSNKNKNDKEKELYFNTNENGNKDKGDKGLFLEADVQPWTFACSDVPLDCEEMGREGPIGGGSMYNYAKCEGKCVTAFMKMEIAQTLETTKKSTMSSGAVVGIVISVILAVGCFAALAAYFGFIHPITKRIKNVDENINEKELVDKL